VKLSRAQRRLIHLVFGSALAVGLHLLWFSLPADSLMPERAWSGRHNGIQVLPLSGSKRWKPVQFALPSAAGFSGVVMGGRRGSLNPLAGTVELSTLGAERPRSVRMATHARRRAPGPEPFPVHSFRPATEAKPSPDRRWLLWWLRPGKPEVIVFHEPELEPDAAVVVEGTIDFDAYGMVSGLRLAPSEIRGAARSALMKALYRVRIHRGQAEDGVPFRLAYSAGRLP